MCVCMYMQGTHTGVHSHVHMRVNCLSQQRPASGSPEPLGSKAVLCMVVAFKLIFFGFVSCYLTQLSRPVIKGHSY